MGGLAIFTRQACILVGGKGTRLGALSATTPKPLMPIDGDRVFLDELLFAIAREGFDNILLLAGHLHDQFSQRYHGKRLLDALIQVVVEPKPAGTAGALVHAKDLLSDRFLFANGDTLFDINLRDLDRLMNQHGDAEAVLALRRVPDRGRYGSVAIDGERVAGFVEKTDEEKGNEGLINGGIGLFRAAIVDRIGQLPASLETHVYPVLASERRLYGRAFEGYFIDIGLPETLKQAREDLPRRRRRPALFLDRDGVLNHDLGYTHKAEDLDWIDGAIETVRYANQRGFFVIVVTNQSGIGYGRYTEDDMHIFHRAMAGALAAAGAHIDGFYWCPYHVNATEPAFQHPNHPDRKPNPGMILRALADWPIDIRRSLLIGDRDTDIEAAKRAGIAGALFEGGNLFDLVSPLLDDAWARHD